MNIQAPKLTPHEAATRRGRLLEYFSVAWMVVEAAVGIASGLLAGSIALVGFGADSVIEVFSSAVLLWRLREGSMGQEREHTAVHWPGTRLNGPPPTMSLMGAKVPGDLNSRTHLINGLLNECTVFGV